MVRTRLTLLNCAVLTLLLTLMGAGVYLTTRATLDRSVDSDLLDRAHFFAAMWSTFPNGLPPVNPNSGVITPPVTPPSLDPNAARREGINPDKARQAVAMIEALRPLLLDLNGRDIMRPERSIWNRSAFLDAIQGRQTFSDAQFEGVPVRVLTVPLRRGGKVTAVAQLATTITAEREMLATLSRALIVVVPLAVLGMLVAGIVLTRQAMRPVGQIASAAERIEATNLAGRLTVRGRDEFAHLASTFNMMLNRLEAAFEAKDAANRSLLRFTSDASHELKTPLTSIRARAGLALHGPQDPKKHLEYFKAIERATEIMGSVLDDLFLLTVSDEKRLTLHREHVELFALVSDAVDSVDTTKNEVRVLIDLDVKVDADPAAITRVLVNLLQNAIKYSHVGSAIVITSERRDHQVWVTVKDDGPGIPSETVDHVFDRFYRVDSSRDRGTGGSGLGLSIARAIVEAHDGTIKLESTVGQGTRVTFSLQQA